MTVFYMVVYIQDVTRHELVLSETKPPCVCRTPSALMQAMTAVLSLYESQRGKGTMLGEAAGLMNPEVIQRLQELQETVRKRFM